MTQPHHRACEDRIHPRSVLLKVEVTFSIVFYFNTDVIVMTIITIVIRLKQQVQKVTISLGYIIKTLSQEERGGKGKNTPLWKKCTTMSVNF